MMVTLPADLRSGFLASSRAGARYWAGSLNINERPCVVLACGLTAVAALFDGIDKMARKKNLKSLEQLSELTITHFSHEEHEVPGITDLHKV